MLRHDDGVLDVVQTGEITASPETDRPLFVVLNVASGSGDAEVTRRDMAKILTGAKRRHEFLMVREPRALERTAERAVERAKREDGAVVAAGGDGTINACAQLALPARIPFGIVPQGTFNYTTRAHGIPEDALSATEALLSARIRPMQVGLVNERVFLVNASVGLYPELLQAREADTRLYGRYRTVAYVSGLVSLFREHRQLTLEIEHDRERELVRTPSLFVGNNPLQFAQVGLPEAEALERHRLAAVVLRPVDNLTLLWLALRGALGKLGGTERIRDFPFRRMSVRPAFGKRRRRLKVATDGEIRWLYTPLEFRVGPEPLLLMTPRDGQP